MRRWLLLIVPFVLLALGEAAQAQSSPVSIKQVDDKDGSLTVVATVLDSAGRPVQGIAADAVELQLDGKVVPVQELRYGADPQTPLGLVLAIDVSGSMAGERLTQARAAAGAFLDSLEPADQVALLIFNSDVVFFSDFTTDRAALKKTIQQMSAGGNTALFRATADAVTKAASAPLPRKAVVLMTDGENYEPAGRTTREQALDAARRAGVPVYSIGLGDEADRSYLDDLAQVSRGQAQHAPSPSDLDRLYRGIGDALRGQYVVRAQPGAVQRAAAHTVRLTVNVNGTPASDEVSFPGTGLALLPDPTPAPTPAPTAAPTAAPTPEAVAQPVPAAATARGSDGRGRAAIAGAALLALAGAALGMALLRRRRRRARRPGTDLETVMQRRGQPAEPARSAAPIEPQPLPAPRGASLVSAAPALLEVCGGPLAGLQVPLMDEPVTIGAAQECGVVLPADGAEVERRHARIFHRDGRYMLHRLARSHSILMNGQGVQWVVLEPNDEFTIGPHRFRFEMNGAGHESPHAAMESRPW